LVVGRWSKAESATDFTDSHGFGEERKEKGVYIHVTAFYLSLPVNCMLRTIPSPSFTKIS